MVACMGAPCDPPLDLVRMRSQGGLSLETTKEALSQYCAQW